MLPDHKSIEKWILFNHNHSFDAIEDLGKVLQLEMWKLNVLVGQGALENADADPHEVYKSGLSVFRLYDGRRLVLQRMLVWIYHSFFKHLGHKVDSGRGKKVQKCNLSVCLTGHHLLREKNNALLKRAIFWIRMLETVVTVTVLFEHSLQFLGQLVLGSQIQQLRRISAFVRIQERHYLCNSA